MVSEKDKAKKKVKRPTAEKRNIQNEKRRLINKSYKSRINTTLKSFRIALQGGDADVVQKNLKSVFSMLDKGVKKNILKAGKADRIKSRYHAKMNVVGK